MKTLYRNLLAGCTLALASPAFAWAPYPDVDFEWYANVGKSPTPANETYPPARDGQIYSPTHMEGAKRVPAHFIKDDFAEQSAIYGNMPLRSIAVIAADTDSARK